MRRAARVMGWCLLALFSAFFVLCTVGEVRQRILVHRAEKLLADMHRISPHQSTWADAQRMMAQWGRWGHYEGDCTEADCFYTITLDSSSIPIENVQAWPGRLRMFVDPFRLLPRQWGGGLRELAGAFLVEDGVLRRVGLSIDMTQSSYAKGAQDVCCGSELILKVVSRPSLGQSWRGRFYGEEKLARHPDYSVSRPGGCSFCLMGKVAYADSMAPEEAVRLSNFQISCATRWSSCLTLEDLDPAARDWQLYPPPWGEAAE